MIESNKTIKLIQKAFVIFTLAASFSAGSVAAKQSDFFGSTPSSKTALFSSVKATAALPVYEVKSRILDQYADWKGVRYRLGGASKKGVDCSAFVQITFREQFGLNLPRTTLGLRNQGKSIAKSQLTTGDLVLFNIGKGTRHVGIYLGNDQFVHASSSRGVMISNLKDSYWTKRYNESRRVLNSANLKNLV